MSGYERLQGMAQLPRSEIYQQSDCGPAMVWMAGEHDLSTVGLISTVLAEVIAATDEDVVIDLSDVTFMDASTLGCLVAGQVLLKANDRSLTLRSPSPLQRMLLEICELDDLVETSAPPIRSSHALESWVEVPVLPRLSEYPTMAEAGRKYGRPAGRYPVPEVSR